MEHRFDSLAKTVSGAMSRREAFWRVGSGLAVGVLASLGLGSAGRETCGQCCAFGCLNLVSPPRGHDLVVCITECHEGAEPVGDLCAHLCAG